MRRASVAWLAIVLISALLWAVVSGITEPIDTPVVDVCLTQTDVRQFSGALDKAQMRHAINETFDRVLVRRRDRPAAQRILQKEGLVRHEDGKLVPYWR